MDTMTTAEIDWKAVVSAGVINVRLLVINVRLLVINVRLLPQARTSQANGR